MDNGFNVYRKPYICNEYNFQSSTSKNVTRTEFHRCHTKLFNISLERPKKKPSLMLVYKLHIWAEHIHSQRIRMHFVNKREKKFKGFSYIFKSLIKAHKKKIVLQREIYVSK